MSLFYVIDYSFDKTHFTCRFSLFVNKSLCQFIFHSILSLIGNLFVLPRILHVNLIN